MHTLTLPVPPSVNGYWRMVTIRGHARMLISKDGRDYKKRVAELCYGMMPLRGEVVVRATVYRPRRIGDLDNYLKSLLDALKGYAFEDDSQVVEIHLHRCEDRQNPRVTVEIEEKPETGIDRCETGR